jgi:3-oxoacyl-[acyl-carrier protein] reductase
MNAMFLEGKTALVTSSSRALGAEISRKLADHGAVVAVNYYSSRAAAAALVEELKLINGRDHIAIAADMADAAGVEGLVAEAGSRLGAIDVLVNNSGPYAREPLSTLSELEWDRVLDSNLKSAFLATQLCARSMKERGWGRIVNVSAVSAQVCNRSVYGLAKRAVEVLTEQMAYELGPEITVNAVSPGQIRESADDMAEFDATWPEMARERTPLGRLGTRSEIAEVVATICGPTFDMLTGATVPLDGGLRFNRF